MKKGVVLGLVWSGGALAIGIGAVGALKLGYIDRDTALRMFAMNGLMIAYYGNRLPKTLLPSAYAAKIMRVAGWSMALSGLVYAGLFVFAPIPIAMTIGTGALLAGLAVMIGYLLWLRAKAKKNRLIRLRTVSSSKPSPPPDRSRD